MKKNKSKIFIIIALLLAIIAGVFYLASNNQNPVNPDEDVEPVEPVDPTPEEPPIYEEYRRIYKERKAINEDYVGEFIFESNLINLPFVQGTDNDMYFRTNWETMKYDAEGSIFIDYRNVLEDQNIIFYGHYVYPSYEPSMTHMFTPLALLTKQENYEDNKYINVVLEDEIIRYEIAYVFHVKMGDDGSGSYVIVPEDMEYFRTAYNYDFYGNDDPGYFDKYKAAMEKAQFYDTGVELTENDNTITLQTCVENRDDLRLVVVAKEIERTNY